MHVFVWLPWPHSTVPYMPLGWRTCNQLANLPINFSTLKNGACVAWGFFFGQQWSSETNNTSFFGEKSLEPKRILRPAANLWLIVRDISTQKKSSALFGLISTHLTSMGGLSLVYIYLCFHDFSWVNGCQWFIFVHANIPTGSKWLDLPIVPPIIRNGEPLKTVG